MPICFVAGCRSGYRKKKDEKNFEKRHFFKVKKENAELWKRRILRVDKPLTLNCHVCDLHFDERYILKKFTHTINGEKVEIERGKWELTEDAIPTIFPNIPKNLKKNLPKKKAKKRHSISRTRKRKSARKGKTLVNRLQKPTNGISEKSVVSSSELPIPISKTKQQTEEVILPTNDEHLNYTLNQRPQVPVIINLRRDDIDDHDSNKQYRDSNTRKIGTWPRHYTKRESLSFPR